MATATEALAATALAPARNIPQNWRESFSYWWHSDDKETAAAQERLLRRLPFFSSSPVAPADPNSNTSTDAPISKVVGRISQFELDGRKRFLNQFAITPTHKVANAPPPTVVLHGYGAGLGFFYLNFNALGDWAGRRGGSVYALDWLGMGLSARVPFKVHAKREDTERRVQEAEDFFVDALEEWRTKNGFETMNLIGHSLGGYLSVAYALRHPTRVSRLILLSPAGVPPNPKAISPTEDAALEAAAAATDAEPEPRPSLLRKLGTHAWEAGWSPFQVVRSITFFGPLLVGKYSTWRFRHLPDEDARDVNNYIWHITRGKGSGEYCISHILAPGAHARLPLVDRVDKLKMPITFVYGEEDWMDVAGGYESVSRLRAAGNKHAKTVVIKYAGHHLYLDNPGDTNELLVKELDKTIPRDL
ncbi:hypothetical protein FRB99_002481 [Tulasnella sp. 403]|nr:hypothetical protein FRB99_002481 [Tulasnella sp. 403]